LANPLGRETLGIFSLMTALWWADQVENYFTPRTNAPDPVSEMLPDRAGQAA
jgi:hypothetical protein